MLQETYQYDPLSGNLSQKGSATLAYNDPAHAHAATDLIPATGTPNTYTYDATP